MPDAATTARRPGAPLAITGLGCVGAPGRGLMAQRHALAGGVCGLAVWPGGPLPIARGVPVGRVTAALPAVGGRTTALALAAGADALADAGLAPHQRGAVALVLGTCTGGMAESERAWLADGGASAHTSFRRQQPQRTTQALARALGLGGAQGTHAVACASAACALIEAVMLVRSGACAAALAIGADALTRVTTAGFTSLQLVDPAGCRPLVAERAGMSLGEGAGALLIEDPAHARARGARVHASLVGWGLCADGYHATRPDPGGAQLRAAIGDSLTDAGLDAAAIGYVNAHGTGTRDNDACERNALAALLGAVPTASSKRCYGHTMGAAAAIEAVACCLALVEQTCWMSAGADLGTPLDGIEVVRSTRRARVDAALSTTLAFGGVNACLAFATGARCA